MRRLSMPRRSKSRLRLARIAGIGTLNFDERAALSRSNRYQFDDPLGDEILVRDQIFAAVARSTEV